MSCRADDAPSETKHKIVFSRKRCNGVVAPSCQRKNPNRSNRARAKRRFDKRRSQRDGPRLGAVDVAANKLWGERTQLSLEHFSVDTEH
jgi:hypothetical protein